MARLWYKGGFCEKISGAAPVGTEAVPDSSEVDLPLAKAELISNVGSFSGVKTTMQQQLAERSENMQEKLPCRHHGQRRRKGRKCARHQSKDSSANPGKDHSESGCPPAAHRGPQWSR